jgi:hypothetical protein
MNDINREILRICRGIENEHVLQKTSYKVIIQENIRPILSEFIEKLQMVFTNSHILIDSFNRYIIIDWSKKDDLE